MASAQRPTVPTSEVGATAPTELVLRLRRRDARAFGELYESLGSRLHTFLLRLSRDEELALDLAQETWLRLAAHAPKLAPDSDVVAWLFSVARNLFRSQRRWQVLDRTRLHDWGLWRTAQVPATPLLDAANHQLGGALERAIANLTLAHREVILLLTVEGIEPAQVAAMLNVTRATLRKRLARARAALRVQLRGREP